MNFFLPSVTIFSQTLAIHIYSIEISLIIWGWLHLISNAKCAMHFPHYTLYISLNKKYWKRSKIRRSRQFISSNYLFHSLFSLAYSFACTLVFHIQIYMNLQCFFISLLYHAVVFSSWGDWIQNIFVLNNFISGEIYIRFKNSKGTKIIQKITVRCFHSGLPHQFICHQCVSIRYENTQTSTVWYSIQIIYIAIQFIQKKDEQKYKNNKITFDLYADFHLECVSLFSL